jgi:hypothetical protein
VPADYVAQGDRVHLIGDFGFSDGYIKVTVDGVPVVHGGSIPVTPGVHELVATCESNEQTRAHGARSAISIENQ